MAVAILGFCLEEQIPPVWNVFKKPKLLMADEHFWGHKICDMLDNSFYFMSQMALLKWFWNPVWQASRFFNPSLTPVNFLCHSPRYTEALWFIFHIQPLLMRLLYLPQYSRKTPVWRTVCYCHKCIFQSAWSRGRGCQRSCHILSLKAC